MPFNSSTVPVILRARTRHRKEPNLSCAGIDNTKVGMHYDIIIMDDVVSTKNVTTPEQMKQVIDQYRLILSLLEPNGELIIIGTRYHVGDLYGHILENESSTFDILVRPAISPDGELFFPSRLTREFLSQQRESQGSYIFECKEDRIRGMIPRWENHDEENEHLKPPGIAVLIVPLA